MEYNHELVEHELRSLVMSLGLSKSEETEAIRYLDFGEYGLTLETAFDIVFECDKSISDDAKATFVKLAEMMGLSQSVDVKQLK